MNESHPLALQTTYRDLLDRHLRRPSPEIVGSVLKVSKGRASCWVARRRVGARVVERHLGLDTAEVRERAEAIQRANEASKAWGRDAGGLAAQLRAARPPTPTTGTGKLVLASSGPASSAKAGCWRGPMRSASTRLNSASGSSTPWRRPRTWTSRPAAA